MYPEVRQTKTALSNKRQYDFLLCKMHPPTLNSRPVNLVHSCRASTECKSLVLALLVLFQRGNERYISLPHFNEIQGEATLLCSCGYGGPTDLTHKPAGTPCLAASVVLNEQRPLHSVICAPTAPTGLGSRQTQFGTAAVH